MTIATRHTEASALTGLPGLVDEDGEVEENLRQPSIWEKKQTTDILAGKSQVIREPSSWAELKLALSVSQTDKRSSHQGGGATLGASTSLGSLEAPTSRPGTAMTTSSTASNNDKEATGGTGPATDSGGTEMALSAKAMKKKQLRKLRALGQTILPIVKNKSYLDAKKAYFTAFPAPTPANRTYKGKASLD